MAVGALSFTAEVLEELDDPTSLFQVDAVSASH